MSTDPPGPLRYQQKRPSARLAYTGLVLCLLVAGGWETVLYQVFIAASRGRSTLAFLFFSAGSLILAGLALKALAATRPWWRREIRGSVYLDRRSFGPEKRYDLAAVTEAAIAGSQDSDTGALHIDLFLLLPETGARALIRLPLGHRDRPGGPAAAAGGDAQRPCDADTRFMVALAEALEQHPDREVAGEAAAGIRRLAAAEPGEILQWLQEQRAEQEARRRAGKQRAAAERAARRAARGGGGSG